MKWKYILKKNTDCHSHFFSELPYWPIYSEYGAWFTTHRCTSRDPRITPAELERQVARTGSAGDHSNILPG